LSNEKKQSASSFAVCKMMQYGAYTAISADKYNADARCECRGGDSWIGLRKWLSGSTSDWAIAQYWLDGTISGFRRWGNGQPNDDTFCFIIKATSGDFDDKSCENNQKFVCKRSGKFTSDLINASNKFSNSFCLFTVSLSY